ncbi:MAG TPA: ribonuclease G, partial [Polyangiaceae bacterium]|nr:ribonuclease G [Polyangiaceae bacterium]
MSRSIIVINVDIRETRVALVEGGVITELQVERASHRSTVGNVVLGKVTRVLPGMQAAFIDVGQERSAFLHVEDLIRPDDFEAFLAGGLDDGDQSFRGTGERKATKVRSGDSDDDDEDDEDDESDAHAERSLNGADRLGATGATGESVAGDDDEDDDDDAELVGATGATDREVLEEDSVDDEFSGEDDDLDEDAPESGEDAEGDD